MKLTILALLHLIVDFICAYTITNYLYPSVDDSRIIAIFLVYNILAFVFQIGAGIIIDKFKNERLFLNISLVVVLLGGLLSQVTFLSVILLGLGNCLFHIVGGKLAFNNSNGKIAPLGFFVSLGAVGLSLGLYFVQIGIFLTLIISMGGLTIIYNLIKDEVKTIEFKESTGDFKQDIIVVVILILAVFIRGIVGKGVSLNWANRNYLLLIVAIATSVGKIAGGLLADQVGIRKAIYPTLFLSILFLGFFNYIPALSLIGLITFNATMPITLHLLNKRLINHEGLSFGLLAASLFPGYLVGSLFLDWSIPSWLTVLCACIITLVIIEGSTRKEKIING